MNERKYYVDWLRVFAMITVFLFHCSRFFDNEGWHLKAPIAQQSEILPILRELFVSLWFMELFFFVSGYAAWYALKKRTGGQYLVERIKRLLVPLYTVGLFILLVPQVYFDRLTKNILSGTFWQWLPGYFRGLPGEIFGPKNYGDPLQLLPYNFGGHLWFIMMLFLVSLAALLVILYLKSSQGQRGISTLAGWSAKPGGIFLFAIPLAVVRMVFYWMPASTDQTWATFLWYGLFFVFGYIIAGDERFTESIKKNGWLCLGLWFGLFIGLGGVLNIALGINLDARNGFSLIFEIWQIFYAVIVWSAIVFLLSIGAKYLNFNNKFLAYSNEAVMPFYLFHQTIILIVGWFVLPWEIGALAKYLIIAAISFPVILFLYEVFVRHINFMRFLFGMAPQKKQIVLPREMASAAR